MIARSTDIKSALRSKQRGFLLNPYRFGGGAASDPYFANVKLLLHAGGANNSTVFTDSSNSPATVTPIGSAKISTAQSKFGGSSMLFDGTGDGLVVTNAKMALGAGDFTIEFFVYLPTNDGLQKGFFGNADIAAYFFTGKNGAKYPFLVNLAGARDSTVVTPIAQWFHLAYVRYSSIFYIYLNGVSVGPANPLNYGANWTNTTQYIGCYGSGAAGSLNGYMDEFRLTVGVARYITNFTPPTAAFPDA